MVVKVTAAMEKNPFTVETTNVINISTGNYADNDVKDNLINVKILGLQARRLLHFSMRATGTRPVWLKS